MRPPLSAPYRLLAFALLLCSATLASAQSNTVDEQVLRAYVGQHVAANAGAGITRFEVKLWRLEALASAAPCQRSEAFLPHGARLWGRSSVGVRCVEGAHWSVLVPVTVTAWGMAAVAASALPSGTVLQPQDVVEQEVELTRESAALVRDPADVAGRTLIRAVHAQQALRSDMVRVTSVVNAGDPVRLRIVGQGFSVVASGQALNAAGQGQSVRVRTDLGKILTGIAREGRHVDVSL